MSQYLHYVKINIKVFSDPRPASSTRFVEDIGQIVLEIMPVEFVGTEAYSQSLEPPKPIDIAVIEGANEAKMHQLG